MPSARALASVGEKVSAALNTTPASGGGGRVNAAAVGSALGTLTTTSVTGGSRMSLVAAVGRKGGRPSGRGPSTPSGTTVTAGTSGSAISVATAGKAVPRPSRRAATARDAPMTRTPKVAARPDGWGVNAGIFKDCRAPD